MIFYWRHLSLLIVLMLANASAFAQQVAPITQPAAPAKIFKIIKSDVDGRDYRYLILPNNLKVLLISDSAVEKSAAALNIHVGSFQNPKQRPGLAHFLEHMLFLGTEKYPQAGEYQEFIAQHGGKHNAYTAQENTNYYFDIENNYLEPALDRFAQFFIAPTFDANYIEREKNAVNAEYLAKMNDDERRKWDVYRTLFKPEHPASNFSVGNLDTLADIEEHSIRDDLIAFYQKFYSANEMALVVISNRKLDELQKIVEPRFGLIPSRDPIVYEKYPALFAADALPASVSIKPVKELRQITFAFPVPDYSARYLAKPWNYLGHILGSESAGSMLALLKSLGWAESLQTGEMFASRYDGAFEITINLTKEGAKAKDQIVSVVFDYLKIISARGISDWRFNELKKMAELNFRFDEKLPALDTVTELSQALHDYPPQDVLWGKYAYTSFDEGLLKEALGYLRKENTFITFVAPEVSTTLASPYYQTPYNYALGIPDILELKPAYHQKLALPERNIFIPKNAAVKAPSMLPVQGDQGGKNIPVLLVNNDQLKAWFLQDSVYRSPKAELNFRFKLPLLNNSVENAARTQLFIALVNDQLSEHIYAASLAGLHINLDANAKGFDLHVAGYTDKQSLLVNKIIEAMAQPDFAPERFEKIKEDLLRDWRNQDKNLPYSILAKKIPRLQSLPFWGASDYAGGLQQVSFEQFKPFANELLRGARVEGLFYGNLYAQDAIKLAALIEHQLLQKKSNRLPQLTKVLRVENQENKSFLYSYALDHKDHAVELYVQALAPTFDSSAHMLLLNRILQPPFYNQLRTEKQLGYIVSVIPFALNNIEASVLVVQSPTVGPELLVNEINTFLANISPYIKENIAINKNALLAELREQPVSLAEQSGRYWKSILLGDIEFSRQQELINAVNKITAESLHKYFETAFLQKSRRLWLSTDKFENVKDFDLIQNLSEYQQKQQGYLFP